MLNAVVSKPLKAQVPERPSTIPQIIPSDIQPPSTAPLQPQEPQQEPSRQLLAPSTPVPTPSEQFPSNLTETFIVEKFEVVGSTVFTQQELAKVLEEFTNRPISLAELYLARSKITDLYVSKGYITSGAYIPTQPILSGIIKIQVVEGKLTSITVRGTRRLNPNYIRSRITVANNGVLNQQRILETLQLLKLDPLIKNLSANLQGDNNPRESILVIDVEEAKTLSTQIILDNARTPAVGSFQRRLQVNEANLLSSGDSLSVGYSNTDASNFINASYTLPLNPRNGTLSFNYGTANSNVIERPFNTLDIKSAFRYYEVTFRQPIIQTVHHEFALGMTASRRGSEVTYAPLGERIGFPQLGSDREGHTRVSALRFFQEWTTRDSTQVFAVRSQFNLGIGVFDATVNKDSPDSRFFYWQGQAQWVSLLAPDTLLLLRLNTQIGSRPLPSLEQFSLGGIESVRGYRQDLLPADSGAFTSAEVQIPVLSIPKIKGLLQINPFVDFGFVWNNSYTNKLDYNTLASAGLGLRWSQGDRFTVRLDWGIPLVSIDSKKSTLQENGLYFSVQYNPF
ncbi:ShlB/FhaC/HecB family hemolysin secretion/activation protein (plasmid) [Nostoc sp. UHCC 0302]|uniref:ShlB/FhaC/HecB family hemolysin secretion/activation protein n=1 Tax=Nostoc sp. UHCC 0302 TaxID=3134896 RepID=UPI00311CBF17